MVDGFKQALVADDFGLTSLPEEMWRARLGIPTSGFVSLMTIPEQPKELALGE